MAINNILKTRIALKIDSLDNWKQSTLPLLNGEAAISYEIDEETGKKKHVQIKIGTTDPYGNLQLWKDLPFIEISLTEYNIQEIKEALSNYFDTIQALSHNMTSIIDDVEDLKQKYSVLSQDATNTDTINFGTLGWYLDCGKAEDNRQFR